MTDEESLRMFGWQSALRVNASHEFAIVIYHEALGLCAVGHGGMQQAKDEAIRKAKEAADAHSRRDKELAAYSLLKHQTLPEFEVWPRRVCPSGADRLLDIIPS